VTLITIVIRKKAEEMPMVLLVNFHLEPEMFFADVVRGLMAMTVGIFIILDSKLL